MNKRSSETQALYQKFSTAHFDFFYIACSAPHNTLFFLFKRKFLNAVHRNRLKRVIKELFRLHDFVRGYEIKIFLRNPKDIFTGKTISNEIHSFFSVLS